LFLQKLLAWKAHDRSELNFFSSNLHEDIWGLKLEERLAQVGVQLCSSTLCRIQTKTNRVNEGVLVSAINVLRV
jgi:hypothetical protein